MLKTRNLRPAFNANLSLRLQECPSDSVSYHGTPEFCLPQIKASQSLWPLLSSDTSSPMRPFPILPEEGAKLITPSSGSGLYTAHTDTQPRHWSPALSCARSFSTHVNKVSWEPGCPQQPAQSPQTSTHSEHDCSTNKWRKIGQAQFPEPLLPSGLFGVVSELSTPLCKSVPRTEEMNPEGTYCKMESPWMLYSPNTARE